MKKCMIHQNHIRQFLEHLEREEKSAATKEKYLRDVQAFFVFADDRAVSKELVIEYKQECIERGYAVRSINSMLASVNSFLDFMGWHDCRVKNIRIQRQTYISESKELSKEEYMRLLKASERDEKMYLVLQTICSTGIRISELQYFTVERVKTGSVTVSCKSKTRTIWIPTKLRKLLVGYAKKCRISTGVIFRGRDGNAWNRSAIWRRMKQLCEKAKVSQAKVFPHNLRKLFARTFYGIEKDIAKLADILGHSSINTTRIYIMTTGTEHRMKIERLGLVI